MRCEQAEEWQEVNSKASNDKKRNNSPGLWPNGVTDPVRFLLIVVVAVVVVVTLFLIIRGGGWAATLVPPMSAVASL